MKILILGATGRTGRLIVEEALKQSYDLNVLVRDKNKISFSSKSINIFQGTPIRRADLAAAMQGCDLIISALGIVRASDAPWSKLITTKNFISESIKNAIAEAGQQGVKRLIAVSAWGVGETKKEIPFWLRWLINYTNLRPVYAEHEAAEKLLANSGLNWTAVRPVALNDSEKLKTLKVSFDNSPKPSLQISRQSVAKFIVDIVKSDKYNRKSPTISEN
jgi:putative NADH-flavin reductase